MRHEPRTSYSRSVSPSAVSGVLGPGKRVRCSFQCSMNVPTAVMNSFTEVKQPQRDGLARMNEKHFTRLGQEQLVGSRHGGAAGSGRERAVLVSFEGCGQD
jgi:hypothetical protein